MSKSKSLVYPLDIQLFAEEGDDGQGGTAGMQTTQASTVDYSKIEEIVNKRSSNASESAIKGYLREQGLSGEELNEAVKQYKSAQTAKEKEEKEKTQNLVAENENLKTQMLNSKIDAKILELSSSLGVTPEKVTFLNKVIDRNGIAKEDGSLDDDVTKKAIETVLEAFPEFKSGTEGKGYVKVGGGIDDKKGKETEDEELARWKKEAGIA